MRLPRANVPNVVIIMTDDMGYSDLGCFGGEIRTPHLDRLANNGLRFTNFYSENMCWVSRAAMLTGVYHRTSMKDGAVHPRCITLAEQLRDAGYQTRLSGKWHLGAKGYTVSPLSRGFQHWYGIPGGASSFFAPHQLTRDKDVIESEANEDPDYYFTHAISDNAVQYIESAPTDKPLFLYVAYTAAHWPLHAMPKDIEAYRGKFAIGWDVLREQRLGRMKQLGIVDEHVELSPRHPEVPAWADEPHQQWQQRRMEVYAAQVTAMDRGVGEIVAALKASDRLDKTLLLYTIDNGGCHVEYEADRKGDYLPEKTRDGHPMIPGNLPDVMPGPEVTYQSYGHGWANVSNTPYRLFKQYDHEGGIRTPMIAHWPDRIQHGGQLAGQVSHLIDILPTVLEAANVAHTPLDPQMQPDGQSLLPAMDDPNQIRPRPLFFSHNKGRAIRDGSWKLVWTKASGWELYDLADDPNERNDLAHQYPARVADLKKKWTQWAEKEDARNALN